MSKLSGFRPQAPTILIVDDEVDVRESLQDLLESSIDDAKVLVAADADEALKILEETDLDLLMSDYRMPGKNGLELLGEVKEKRPMLPTILITAFPDQELARRAIEEARAENFLSKPVRPENLVEVVNAAILKGRKRAQDAADFEKRKGLGRV